MTRRAPRRLLGASVLAVTGLVIGACGDDPPEVDAAAARTIEPLEAAVPVSMAGLRVEEEDIAELLETGKRPYLDAAALYSIREDDDLLQATLQIGRFAEDVDVEDEDFRDLILSNIGANPKQVRMGDHQLWMTGADRQTLSIWFEGDHLFILSTRDGFEGGRALLREALEIEP